MTKHPRMTKTQIPKTRWPLVIRHWSFRYGVPVLEYACAGRSSQAFKSAASPNRLCVSEALPIECKAMKAAADSKNRFVIIMAGGRGEQFWPVSREKTPKQLIHLLGKASFLQQTVERVLPLVPARNILVITNELQAP